MIRGTIHPRPRIIGNMTNGTFLQYSCPGFGSPGQENMPFPWSAPRRICRRIWPSTWNAALVFSRGCHRLVFLSWVDKKPRNLLLAALLAALLVTAASGDLYGQTAPQPGRVLPGDGRVVLTERGIWDYAETLFRGGEFYRAISEYKRLLHYFPNSTLERAARMRIGEAYLQGGEPGQGVAHFGVLLTLPMMAPFRPEMLYLRGIGRLELKRHLPYQERADQIRAGLNDLRAIPAEWPSRGRVDAFVRAMDSPPRPLPAKSPWLAGGLSALVPGAGSAYGGRWPEAALAFFINALFIGATAEAAREDDDDLAFVLGIGALAFYAGNVYAAVNGAHKFNDRIRAAYLEQQRLRFGLVLRPGGLRGILEKRF